VTFFDSAELYGDGYSEQLIGRALGGVRDEIVIASKAAPDHFAPDELRAACERSLGCLGTDRIDLYQLHWPHPEIPVAETLGVMAELREEGKIRAIGVSNFGPHDLAEALAAGVPIASNQLAYSLLFRAIEFEILPLCVEESISVLCYSPMLQGLLTGKFAAADDVPVDRARTRHFSCERRDARHGEPGAEAGTFAAVAQVRRVADLIGEPMANVALAWLLAEEGVASVIAGGRSPAQALINARAADLELSPDVVADLAAATDALKQTLGPNADMWQTDSRIR
jgi:aryl-alcohol dehydrogenase-like predicted oxidoreductase